MAVAASWVDLTHSLFNRDIADFLASEPRSEPTLSSPSFRPFSTNNRLPPPSINNRLPPPVSSLGSISSRKRGRLNENEERENIFVQMHAESMKHEMDMEMRARERERKEKAAERRGRKSGRKMNERGRKSGQKKSGIGKRGRRQGSWKQKHVEGRINKISSLLWVECVTQSLKKSPEKNNLYVTTKIAFGASTRYHVISHDIT